MKQRVADTTTRQRAAHYTAAGTTIHCSLCHHRCAIGVGMRGRCAVRENCGGVLYTDAYGDVVALAADPVEKKPLFHVAPGAVAFSFAAEGCNFSCSWCQNHQISQAGKAGGLLYGQGHPIPPEVIVEEALSVGAQVLAATYTEPTVFYELARDVAHLGREAGLLNVWVTNGSLCAAPLEELAPFLDAANVDLKGVDPNTTQHRTGMSAVHVMETIDLMVRLGIWVEITTLVVPGFNDSPQELTGVAQFIASLNPSIPWHVTRYYPQYQETTPPTPLKTLALAQHLGKAAGLRYVYTGNTPTPGGEETHCHQCGALLISRKNYTVLRGSLSPKGLCTACNTPLAGLELTSEVDS